MKQMRHGFFMAAAATLALSFAATAASAAGIFTLESKTFSDGKVMPKKVANTNTGNSPNCVGENVSPELHWSNVPDGTKSLVLLMSDPEGRAPSGVSHWVAYGIDPSKVTGFAEGETSKTSDKYVGGKSTMGVGNYSGPCTPPGPPHHYTFVLIATDFAPDELPAGLTRDEIIAKFGPPPAHVKGSTGLIGLFVNPWHD